MNIGLLWYDPSPKAALGAKVERAAVYYQKKYGKRPNLCFVHPTMLRAEANSDPTKDAVEEELSEGAIEIRTSRSVLPNHFWIGVDKEVNYVSNISSSAGNSERNVTGFSGRGSHSDSAIGSVDYRGQYDVVNP